MAERPAAGTAAGARRSSSIRTPGCTWPGPTRCSARPDTAPGRRPSPTGPWTYRGHPDVATNAGPITPYVPQRTRTRACSSTTTGSGYVVITDATTYHPVVERLTADFLDSDQVRLHPPGVTGVESPTMFQQAGRYYMFVGTPEPGVRLDGDGLSVGHRSRWDAWTWGGA